MRLPFTKMHGAGNDFVVVDATRHPFPRDPALLQRLADRRFGVGCDQILVIEPASTPDVDFDYRIYNADGSEVGQCGNGSRAFARYVRDKHLSDADEIRVRTSTSRLTLYHEADGQVRVNMGVPALIPAQVPIQAETRALSYPLTLTDGRHVDVGAVSMGNPHAVLWVDNVDTADVEALGPAVQQCGAFPEGVNVGFMQQLSEAHVRLRVYERGSGETLACGSGACAAVVAGRLQGRLGPDVRVDLRGGTLRIQWAGEGQPVWMTGPAVTVFEGEIEW